MITLNRDPTFWTAIAAHPAMAPMLHGADPSALGEVVQAETVIPLAAEHGGFIFVQVDQWKANRELHTLFTPEGWGREVHDAGREALRYIFDHGHALIVSTFQMLANPRSQPPRTFGFQPLGEVDTEYGRARYWTVTREQWEASPAQRRMAA